MILLVHTGSTLLDYARRLAADPARWPVPPRFEPTGRWYSRLARTDDTEGWLLTWLPGQQADWHDHGGSAGAFVVVSGRLREDTAAGTRHFAAGAGLAAGRRFGARHVHRVINDCTVPTMSVHVYAPALTAMTRYEMVDGALRVRSVERAGADW